MKNHTIKTAWLLGVWLTCLPYLGIQANQVNQTNQITQPQPLQLRLQNILSQPPQTLTGKPTYLNANQLANLQDFYAARAYQLAWTAEDYQAWSNPLFEAFKLAAHHGLNPNHPLYHQEHLNALINQSTLHRSSLDQENTLLRDLWLSSAFMSLSQHLVQGVAPELGANKIHSTLSPRAFNAPQFLEKTLRQRPIKLTHALESLAPKHQAYLNLQKALAFYKTLSHNNAWLTEPNAYINPENVRQRLMLTGDYTKN
ncbi:hypothetical protein [Thiomicrorhabdus aquaedulcis]|uniref:hypothetical protein n=1 Tax=Thiomicrorhabdus aquaedulcis TaxID=2211106 RepID=UPI000FD77326|nr:hypothetical protein [Thiomicrorhabdus aquaedulcis]